MNKICKICKSKFEVPKCRKFNANKYCSRSCYWKDLTKIMKGTKISVGRKATRETLNKRSGENAYHWKGSEIIRGGYYWIERQGHMRSRYGRVKRCDLVAEKFLNRNLKPNEFIHHIDENKLNDDPHNLYVTNKSEHCRIHRKKIKVMSNIV